MDQKKTDVEERVKIVRRFISFAGLLVVLMGLFLTFSAPVIDERVFPYKIWVSVAGAVIFILGLNVRASPWVLRISERLKFSRMAGGVIVSLLLSILVVISTGLFKDFSRVNFIPVLTLWLLSFIIYISSVSSGAFDREAWKSALREHRGEIAIVTAITALAAFLRFYLLGSIPRVIDGDEGLIGLAAQFTDKSTFANPFALWENIGSLYLILINLGIKLFGPTAFGLRFFAAVGGTLAIPAIYLFARQVAGRQVAVITAIMVATSHAHIHFSRIVSVAYIHATWLVPLELYFLFTGLEKRNSTRTAIAGVLLAIHFSIYLTAQIIFGLILIFMVAAFFVARSWFRPALRQALVFWGGFFITILPELSYAYKNPAQFFTRINADGTFQSGWLAREAVITGQGALSILADRVAHAFLSLIYYPAFDFYGSPMPTLGMIATALLFLGLGIALLKTRTPGFLLLNGYFWAITLAIGFFSIPPSADSYRMLAALPAAFILVAIGLDRVLESFDLGWQRKPAIYALSSGAILMSLMIFNIWTYYGDFAGQCRFGGGLGTRFASYLGLHVKTLRGEETIYLLSNSLYFYGSHGSVDFLSQHRPITNFSDPVDALHPVSGETIIASPDRISELKDWARLHPGGEVHYEYDCSMEILMSYRVP